MNNSAAKTWSVGPGVAATGPAGRHVKVPQKREHVSSSSSNPTFTIAASSSGATEAQPLALPQSSATKYQQSASAHIRSCSPSSSACRCHFRHTAADAPLGAVRGAYIYTRVQPGRSPRPVAALPRRRETDFWCDFFIFTLVVRCRSEF